MSDKEDQSPHWSGKKKKQENHKSSHGRETIPANELWTDGLICAFEFVRGRKKSVKLRSSSKITDRLNLEDQYLKKPVSSDGLMGASSMRLNRDRILSPSVNALRDSSLGASASDDDRESQVLQAGQFSAAEKYEGSHWVPIGWGRISELVRTVQVDADWSSYHFEFEDQEDDLTVADLAAPYWERPAGPIWWCHVCAGHPNVEAWLSNAQWLHPAVSLAER